jgi:hypothetical protein
MKKYYLLLIPVVILITIFFFPYQSKKESSPAKVDPKTEMVKRIAKMIKKQSRVKEHKISAAKLRATIKSKEKEPQNRIMAISLREELKRYAKEGKENIRIVLNTKDETEGLSNSIINAGGRIIRKRPGFMAVEVPTDKAEQLIMSNGSIGYARLPFKFYPAGKVTEGVNLTGANILHDANFKGAGVKVAVVDVGFKGLTAAISAGELPADVITQNFSEQRELQTEYVHGTACAEIVHDMAPEAELYLVKLGDEIGGYEVINYLIDNNIDIVSLSLGTFGSGPGNGTGYLDEAFDELRAAGILVVASAGNFGNTTYKIDGDILTYGTHWEGTFNNTSNDRLHEFISGDPDSYYNIIEAYPTTNDDGDSETGEVSVVMRWNNAWPGSNIDYDMYLFEYDYDTDEFVNPDQAVASSTNYQEGKNTDEPLEWMSIDIPDNEDYLHYYALVVTRLNKLTSKKNLEIYLGGTSEFVPFNDRLYAISTSSSSISEPADAESVMAAGAIDYTKWQTGPQEEYSSQGPTNAWNGKSARIKPDIMGPDFVTTYTYGDMSFPGTSAAAPHVAGMAALILSTNLNMTPAEIQDTLEASSVDMGTSGKDNLYGYGRLLVKDTDNDSIFDENEDKNHNGIVDSGETDPNNADTDHDNMPDGWEVKYGLNPLVNDANGDLDNDGFSNIKEYQKGTLPNDRKSRPKRSMPWLPLLLED